MVSTNTNPNSGLRFGGTQTRLRCHPILRLSHLGYGLTFRAIYFHVHFLQAVSSCLVLPFSFSKIADCRMVSSAHPTPVKNVSLGANFGSSSLILLMATYAAETWTIKSEDIRKLEALEMRYLGAISGVNCVTET